MADTPADVLGTSDAIPPNLAAPAPTGVATGIPAAVAAPAAGTDMPTPMGSTPGSETPTPPQDDPEVATGAVHQNWLARILDSVGTILGGDKTIVATKHPDGSVSVEHNPSTTGEKWGRIAQAALGGAARGMAVGQGPGGAGKAFAAGGLAGLQMPAQQLAAANEEAKNMNAQQLAAANMALTHQSYLANAEEMRERGIKFTQDQADRYNAILKSTRDAPGSEDLGDFVGVTDLPSLKAKYPDAYAAHLSTNDKVLQFDPKIDPKTGQQTGSHITLLSKPLSERVMPPGTPPLTQSYYDAATHSIQSRDIDPTAMTRVEYSTAHQNLTKQNSDLALSVDKELHKAPTNQGELQTALQLEPNPVKRQALQTAYDNREHDILREKEAGRAPAAVNPGPNSYGPYAAMAADMNANKLDISQIRTRKDWPQIYTAARQYAIDNGLPAFDAETATSKFAARKQVVSDFLHGKEADQIQTFNNFLGHSQDLLDATQSLRNPTDLPFLNTPINKLETNFAGDPRIAILKPKINVVRKEYQNFLENNRALHNDDITEGGQMLNDSQSLAQMEGAVKSFTGAAITRAGTTADRARNAGFEEIIPHILNNNSRRTVANMGLQKHLDDVMGTTSTPAAAAPAATAPTNAPAAAAAPAQNVVPAGATPGRDATGKVIGYRLPNGTQVRF